MAELTIFGVLVGAILGSRFNVLSLVLAVGVTIAGIVFDGVERQVGMWSVAGEIVVASLSLQAGYLAGSALASLVDSRLDRLFGRDRSRVR